MTSAFALYQDLSLPVPWHPATTPIPLIIYGAAAATGSYAIQLAKQSNIHPLICVAGRGIPYVERLMDKSKGDIILDYTEGRDKLVENLKAAVQKAGGKVEYAFDAVSEHGSFEDIGQVLDPKTGQLALILPGREYHGIPEGITTSKTSVGAAYADGDSDPWQKKTGTLVGNPDFAFTFFRYFGRGLQQGFFKGHPYQIVPGGLGGVQQALTNLKAGKASAVKYVFRLEDTEGVAH